MSKPKQVFGMPYELRNYNKGPDLPELKELHLHLGGGEGGEVGQPVGIPAAFL